MQKENLYEENCIRTNSGIYFNVIEPREEMFEIEDIAHALAHMPRFGGHLDYFYSVAQHSICCCEVAPPEDKLALLMHDASEAYLMDLPRPIKKLMPIYQAIESNIMTLISKRFGFKYPFHKGIKKIDDYKLEVEWNLLFLGKRHAFEKPLQVKKTFLEFFKRYSK